MANTTTSLTSANELSIEDILGERGSELAQRDLMHCHRRRHFVNTIHPIINHGGSNVNNTVQVNFGGGTNVNNTHQSNFGGGSNVNNTVQVNFGGGTNVNNTVQGNF